MKKLITIFFIVLLASILYLGYQNRSLSIKYKNSVLTIKAYESQLDTSRSNSRIFKLTIDLLKYSKDSIINKLTLVQKELGIKNRRIELLQYSLNHALRYDTLVLKDTIFRNPLFRLDTIIGNKWFKTNLHLEFPSSIFISPEIVTETYTFITGNKETVNPPKKFFLLRWFQRKHIVVEVLIKEKNPYVKTKESRFIQIIK